MTEPLIRPAVDADAAALGVLGRQTFLDTFVDGFGIPYPAGDLAAFLDASFSPEAIRAKLQEPGAAWWVAGFTGERRWARLIGPFSRISRRNVCARSPRALSFMPARACPGRSPPEDGLARRALQSIQAESAVL